MAQFGCIVPLGKMAITAAGTVTPLSVNCGPLEGSTGGGLYSYAAGRPLRQITVEASSSNTGNLYLLPRSNTAAGNPGNIIGVLAAGASVTIPSSLLDGNGITPETLVLDTDAASGTQYAYGYGVRG